MAGNLIALLLAAIALTCWPLRRQSAAAEPTLDACDRPFASVLQQAPAASTRAPSGSTAA
jgi:hypothetical protein